jgi:alanine racemase
VVASVPVGYFEGVDRRLSNRGVYMLGDKPCPLLGRVSMNITSIDVTDVPDVVRDATVVIISRRTSDKNSVENIAKEIGAIPWEVLVHIPEHLSRRVVE